MQKKKIALLSILSGITLLIIWIILPIFVSNKGIISIISFLISISGYMLIGLGIGYLTKIKHLNKT
ncbi:hypothetical protein HH195_11515 (plasmid) [Sarcina sp. JB2]|uniref:Uncharacterized protein n=1 Tax=Candidatus Sarcina troglodytae TaxID=2726954 RepID=A0ACD1BGE0_9CLOT|nr:hypothetical protein [Sarcina sp. JB2]QPJ86591.1 hypothetical protein HH195_11515 [Sarcina sp. JB2]